TTRIPLSKEPARPVDTVMVVRTDTVTRTITRRIHDTVRVTRVDTVHTAPGVVAPIRIREIGGFYVGLTAGPTIPSADNFRAFQGPGWHFDVPVGWDPLFSPAGARLNFGYSQFGRSGPFENGLFDLNLTTPEIFHIDGNLKLHYPVASPWMR